MTTGEIDLSKPILPVTEHEPLGDSVLGQLVVEVRALRADVDRLLALTTEAVVPSDTDVQPVSSEICACAEPAWTRTDPSTCVKCRRTVEHRRGTI